MTTFYVGQRVKMVRGTEYKPEGVVVGFDTDGWPYDICIKIDRQIVNEIGQLMVPGEVVDAQQEHWEPVVPEGHQPAELSVEELLPFLKGKRVQA